MDQLIIGLVMAFVKLVPELVQSIQASDTLDEEKKKKLLFDLNLALTEANVHVQQVRFKEVGPIATTTP